MRPYPKLMAHKIVNEEGEAVASPEHAVVFFSNVTWGMVVHSCGEKGYPSFGYIGEFNPNEYTDVTEDVVIWLTEGPKEPIHEAIEMIEKMKRLPSDVYNGTCAYPDEN